MTIRYSVDSTQSVESKSFIIFRISFSVQKIPVLEKPLTLTARGIFSEISNLFRMGCAKDKYFLFFFCRKLRYTNLSCYVKFIGTILRVQQVSEKKLRNPQRIGVKGLI